MRSSPQPRTQRTLIPARLSRIAAVLVLATSCVARSHVATQSHELRIADWTEPTSLNPLLAHDQDTIGLDLLFVQTLVGLSRGNRLVPILVTRVPTRANGDVSPDGRTIVYHLRAGVRFGDGRPLTSSDVAFTFHAIMDPRNPVLSQDAYRRIASLTTPDPNTVVVRLRAPWNAAVRELFAESDFAFGILPAHAFTSTAVQGAPWEEHAFGTGPFRVTRWRRGDSITLERNPYFSPRPKLAGVVLRLIPDLNAAMVAVRSNEADLTRVQASRVAELPQSAALRLVKTPINGIDYVLLQTVAPPTSDARVRIAIAKAIDIPLLERPLHGLNPPAGAFLPPVLAWHDGNLAPVAANDAAAAAELDTAGWHLQHGIRTKDGVPLEVLIVTQSGTGSSAATIVQRALANVGIQAAIKAFPTSAFNGPDGPLRTGRFNISLAAWIGGADPEQSVIFACDQIGPNGNNISRFCDRDFEAAFADQAIAPSDARRARDFLEMQKIVYHRLPVIPLDYVTFVDAARPGVTGFARNMLGYPVDAETWDVRR